MWRKDEKAVAIWTEQLEKRLASKGFSPMPAKQVRKNIKKIQPGSVTRIYSNVNLRGHVVSTNEGALSKEFLLWTDFLRYQSVIWQPMG